MKSTQLAFAFLLFASMFYGAVPPASNGWQIVASASDWIDNAYWQTLYQDPDANVAVANGVLTATAGVNYLSGINIYAPQLKVSGDFGITATISISPGGSAWLQLAGSLTTGPLYWNNQKYVAVGLNQGNVSLFWSDGTTANITGSQGWGGGTFSGPVNIELLRQGTQFSISINGTLLGRVPDIGIFSTGNVYPGINVSPGSQLTITGWAAEMPQSQQNNIQVISPAAVVSQNPYVNTLRTLTTSAGLRSGVSDNGPTIAGQIVAPLTSIAAGGSYYIQPSGSLDPKLRQEVDANFNQLIVEICCQLFEPSQGRFTLGYANYLADFAANNGMSLYGSSLVESGNGLNPSWIVNGNFSHDQLVSIMQANITQIVTSFKGRMQGYNVVNEPFSQNGDGNLRTDSPWTIGIGSDFIPLAFQLAHQLDANAELYLNEVGAENAGVKADAVYNLVKDLVASGVPITGVGMESHFTESGPTVDLPVVSEVEANMRRLADLGLKVRVSEMDVRILLPATAADLAAQAQAYANMATACLVSDSDFGLGGSVFTGDVERGKRLATQIETGMMFINNIDWSDAELPFGGIKDSGYGRELGDMGIQEFVNKKLVRVHDVAAPVI